MRKSEVNITRLYDEHESDASAPGVSDSIVPEFRADDYYYAVGMTEDFADALCGQLDREAEIKKMNERRTAMISLRARGFSVADIAEHYGVSYNTAARIMKGE